MQSVCLAYSRAWPDPQTQYCKALASHLGGLCDEVCQSTGRFLPTPAPLQLIAQAVDVSLTEGGMHLVLLCHIPQLEDSAQLFRDRLLCVPGVLLHVCHSNKPALTGLQFVIQAKQSKATYTSPPGLHDICVHQQESFLEWTNAVQCSRTRL